VPVKQLTPWPDNPRTITKVDLRKLQRSIKEFGFVAPLVVRRSDHLIIGGHQRLEAAKGLHLKRVPVVYVQVNDAQARALNLALNRIGGEWDLPKLGELLEELRGLPDIDVAVTGFDEREIEQLLAELEREQLPEPYEETFSGAAEMLQADKLKAPTRVQPGELWRLGRHRLLCGDSLEEGALACLLDGQQVDYVLTDPPYGISFRSTLARRGRRKQPIENDAAEQFDDLLARALPAIKESMKPGGVLHWFAGGGGPEPVLAKAMLAVAEHFTLLNTIVWDKVDPGLGWRWRRSWEAVIEASVGSPRLWNGGTGLRNVLRFPRAIPGADEHPTPKPIPLLEQLIRAAAPSTGLLLDPFAGAGSTLVAAERTGRRCLAVELERRYCDLTVARWEALTGEQATRVEQEGGQQ
jgi:DNA modification methylase